MSMQRRDGFGRRATDRLLTREGTQAPFLERDTRLETQVLLLDEDLREAAQALVQVEAFLKEALRAIEDGDPTAMEALALDDAALDRAEILGDTLLQMRRRLLTVARRLTPNPQSPGTGP